LKITNNHTQKNMSIRSSY